MRWWELEATSRNGVTKRKVICADSVHDARRQFSRQFYNHEWIKLSATELLHYGHVASIYENSDP